jgi:hypothetical protein
MVNLEWSVSSSRLLIIIVSASRSMTHFLPYVSNTRNFRTILAGVALVVIFLLMVWTRVFYGSMQACREGEVHLQKTQYIKAITFFDRSIHWYTPFNPYVHKSAERLWEISGDAEEMGDIRLALIAARTLRRGFVAARSFYIPDRNWIERCDLRIHELVFAEQAQKGLKTAEKPLEPVSVLNHPQVRAPDPMWSAILLVGLLGWVGSVIGFIMRGFRIPWGSVGFKSLCFRWMPLWAAFFSMWIFGMVNA